MRNGQQQDLTLNMAQVAQEAEAARSAGGAARRRPARPQVPPPPAQERPRPVPRAQPDDPGGRSQRLERTCRSIANDWSTFIAAARCACCCAAVARLRAAARSSASRPNFKDADITQIAEAVSAATGKNFIIDPRVRAQVTMLSSTPMSPDAFYEAFLSILQVHGFVAMPSGQRHQDHAGRQRARRCPANDLPDRVSRPRMRSSRR